MKKVITPQQIKALLVLRDELHFGRAAVRLGVAQPQLSAMVRRVEEVAGFVIFERRPAVRLTHAGSVFIGAGAQMLADLDASLTEARMIASGTRGRVRVGYSSTVMFAGLADVLTEFANEYPLVDLRLREGSSPRLYEQFSRGDLDLIITRSDGTVRAGRTVELVEDRIVALLPEHHAAVPGDPLSLAELNEDRFIFFRRSVDPEYVDRIMTAAHKGGLKPARVQEVDSWTAAIALVRGGFGVTLATSLYQRLQIPGVRFCEVKEALPNVSFNLIYDPDRHSPSSAHLVSRLLASPGRRRDADGPRASQSHEDFLLGRL